MERIRFSMCKIDMRAKAKVNLLFKICKDYFIQTEGKECSDSKDFFEDLPPNKSRDDKYLFGIYIKENLVGVVDLVRDFPENGEWIIGLLLISPSNRGKGLGKEIHKEIAKFAKSNGAEKLRIGVIEGNDNALKFWQRMGYKQIKITEPREFGEKMNRIIVMNYYL